MVRKKFTRREIVIGLAIALFVVPVLTFYIWHQVEVIRLGYERQELELRLQDLTTIVDRLEAEKASYLSLDKVEKIARDKLGYLMPRDDQILFQEQDIKR